VLEPFLAAVERARVLPPLRPQDLAGSALELRIAGLLRAVDDGAIALVSLSGLHDPAALAKWAQAQTGVQLLDLKQTAQSLASAWRSRVLMAMAVAALLLAMGVWLALRDPARVRRVLLPVALASALIVGLLHAANVPLTLFHLVSLVLAAGLGVDYALFFEHAGRDASAQRRTLHSLLVCAASTLLVFSLLGSSQIPVLRAIGSTVALGVLVHFTLSLLLSTQASATAKEAELPDP
jgi:predicted exporter